MAAEDLLQKEARRCVLHPLRGCLPLLPGAAAWSSASLRVGDLNSFGSDADMLCDFE